MKQAQAMQCSVTISTRAGEGSNESNYPGTVLPRGGTGCIVDPTALQYCRMPNSDATMSHY